MAGAGGGGASARGWDELLQRSRQLVDGIAADTYFPPVQVPLTATAAWHATAAAAAAAAAQQQSIPTHTSARAVVLRRSIHQRSLDQLENLSRQLKAKTTRLDSARETMAATRLLAREGIDADQLTHDLHSFELKTTFEDVFPVEATSVDEYLQQIHEMAILSAIEEAQKDNLRNFDAFMQRAAEEDRQQTRRQFVQSLSRLPTLVTDKAAAATQVSGQRQLPPVPKTGLLAQTAQSPESVQEQKAAAYAEIVHAYNDAREHNQPFDLAGVLKEAHDKYTKDVAGTRVITMSKIWQLVQSMLADKPPSDVVACRAALIGGARHHLEQGHAQYLFTVIQGHATQAALGGSTSNLQRVRAFLRGLLDFDAGPHPRQPPLDTTWHQIYLCLRSGYHEEARQVAESSRISRATFASALEEWLDTGGHVSARTASAMAEECERIARSGGGGGERQGGGTWRPFYDKKKMLLHLLLGGAKLLPERLSHDIPTLFATIEDFLWFKLAVLDDTAPAPSSSFPGAASTVGPCSLGALQVYLRKFDASYYVKGGKDPLLYPYVLILSQQLQFAISHLAQLESENLPGGSPGEAAHIGLAMAEWGALQEGVTRAEAVLGLDAAAYVASLVRQQGAAYARRGNLRAALDYYLAAASAMGKGGGVDAPQRQQAALEQLLVELLRVPGGAALLLGPPGSGSLSRHVTDPAARRQLTLQAATEGRDAGQLDEARELFRKAGDFARALEVANCQLSEAIAAEKDAQANSALEAGVEILDAHDYTGSRSTQDREALAVQQAAFRQLQVILDFQQLYRSGKYLDAVRQLTRLPFLPLEGRTLEKSLECLRSLTRPAEDRVPDLFSNALSCLDTLASSSTPLDPSIASLRSKIIQAVANSLQRNWPQDLYERVARMHGMSAR
eukprot:SM000011S19141  [mRNA]  locus=s11:1160349:1165866:+ [translate_table: standard]